MFVFSLPFFWRWSSHLDPLSQQRFKLLVTTWLWTSILGSIFCRSVCAQHFLIIHQAGLTSCAVQLRNSVQFLRTFQQKICAKGKRFGARETKSSMSLRLKAIFFQIIVCSVWCQRVIIFFHDFSELSILAKLLFLWHIRTAERRMVAHSRLYLIHRGHRKPICPQVVTAELRT